ncbi:MAG: hypothetical protein J6D04_05655 [Clostridia bacterium]|nr:hypothetical protein [Clostridia bacterium]
MGFAIICILAVYGIGAILLTVYDALYQKKRCHGCQVSLTATLNGGACCEWVARRLLYEAKNGRLPIQKITIYADRSDAEILKRLFYDESVVTILPKESEDAIRADYGDCDRDCFCQP